MGNRDLKSVLLVSLERLSYRGYDSAGIASLSDNELSVWKSSGNIHELEKQLENKCIAGNIGIGHTRWATHGKPTTQNAHPHLSPNGRIAVVHNGIIENYQALKSKLIQAGVLFQSETDTEVISALIEQQWDAQKNTLEAAVIGCMSQLEGSFSIAVIAEQDPETVVLARKGSPLIIGKVDQEWIFASDVVAILPYTQDMLFLPDTSIATLSGTTLTLQTFDQKPLPLTYKQLSTIVSSIDKKGYAHYMLKEIYDQPHVLRNILSHYPLHVSPPKFDSLPLEPHHFSGIQRIIIQACGTSWHAGLIGKYLLETHARISTSVEISSEFRYKDIIGNEHDLLISLSQSGETADTLASLFKAQELGLPTLSFVNAENSQMARHSGLLIPSKSGIEIGVASTKNFIAQVTTLYLFSLYLGLIRWNIDPATIQSKLNELQNVPAYLEHLLAHTAPIQAIAKKYAQSKLFLFIGRNINYPSALEGALKLKEISYINAVGYAAGELKHGPIALIDSETPVICIAPESSTYAKVVSNIEEIRARSAQTIVLATEGNTAIHPLADHLITIPKVSEYLSPLLVAIPLQLLAYYIAIERGCHVDQPRNLAKSVTVE